MNFYAWMACSAGDKKRTLLMLNKLKQDIDYLVWQKPFTYDYCVRMVDLYKENDRMKTTGQAASKLG